MTKQKKESILKDRYLMWFGAEIIFSKQQQKQMRTLFAATSTKYQITLEVTTKESMKANKLGLKMERGSL